MTDAPDPAFDDQARALTDAIGALFRRFKLEPGLLAGSPYADLHVNDVALLQTLAQAEAWTVRGLAQAIAAPVTTVSSALDRLEARGLIARRRSADDRRVVEIALAAPGRRLVERLRAAQVENSRAMLAPLDPAERRELVRLIGRVAEDSRGPVTGEG